MSPKVAFIVVSHSAKIAEGVKQLAAQMARDVTIEAAGGLDDGSIGTSYDLIEAALGRVREQLPDVEGAGVVFVTDLGSATFTVESLLDMEDDDHLVLAEGPLVEGTIAGAVIAQVGESLNEVVAAVKEAAGALVHDD